MKTITKASVVLLFVLALFAACRPQEVAKPPDEVTVQLKWIHQAQFAGCYAADKKGFYAEENIDVTLKPGGRDISPDQAFADLIAGETAFTIQGGDQSLAARFRGEPVVAIAVVFQKNPYVYVTLKDSGIKRPQDMVGKKVTVPAQAEIQHLALLKRLDIDPTTIEYFPSSPQDVTPLTTGQIDVHMAYRTGTGLAFDETGYELNFIWVDDYGIHLYADTIIASEQLIQQNPDLVERFLRATLKGWRYAIENPAEAVDMTLQYDPTLTRDRQARMMETQTPLIHTGEAEIGWMDRGVWEGMQDISLEEGTVARERIKQKARDIAKQMEDYIKKHPDMTLKDLQEDLSAQEIAVQPVGKTGYTAVSDASTGMLYFHPVESVVGEDPAQSREAFPVMWEIMDQAIGATCRESSGFYLWGEPGEIREKYMHLACIDAKTADGKRLFASASTCVEEYALALSEKEIEIDEAFTMQFLNKIYGKTE